MNLIFGFVLCSFLATLHGQAQTNTLVVGWGRNDEGQASPPIGLTNAIVLATGWNHCLALKSDRTVIAWGSNAKGQATVPSGLASVIAVSAGQFHSLALKSDGTVAAWGGNLNGQTTVPTSANTIVAVAAGGHHSLALKRDGTVIAWGDNGLSQSRPPAGLSNVTAIAAGHYHSLALKSDGTVVAWGKIWNGLNFIDPTPPAGLTGVVRIATGHFHCLALKSDRTVVAWGDNSNGQSTVLSGLVNVAAVSGGRYHSIVLRNDGTVLGWGNNLWGQAGLPSSVTGVSEIAAGAEHTLVLQLPTSPTIIIPPTSQTVLAGRNVTFSVLASGTAPLSYQWLKDGTAITGAVDPVFTLSTVRFADAGNYAVEVRSPGGAVTVTASLTVGPVLQAIGTNTSGGIVSVPIRLTAAGGENAFGFSLAFDTSILQFTNAVVGTSASGAGLNLNTNQLSTGKLGLALALPSGTSLSQGDFEIAVVNFIVTNLSISTETTIKFEDKPVAKQVSDLQANGLTSDFRDGVVVVISGVEGDTDSDGLVTAIDVTKIGRIAARLDTTGMTNGLLQRADCAPLSKKGDGKIEISDWVQVGRFAAGLDPGADAGGLVPSLASLTSSSSADDLPRLVVKSVSTRTLQIQSSPINAGQRGDVRIQLRAQGQENSVGFTLLFDPTKLAFSSATRGNLTSGSLFFVNSDDAHAGKLGVLIALPAGSSFPAGLQDLVSLSFNAKQNVSGGVELNFSSDLVVLEAASLAAIRLPLLTSAGSLNIVARNRPLLRALLGQSQGIRLRITNSDGSPMGTSDLPKIEIYATEDLTRPLSAWQKLTPNFKVMDGDLVLEESAAPGPRHRFYRAVTKP